MTTITALSFTDTLDTLSERLDLPALHDYAAEDTDGGYDGGAGVYPCGSLWTVEGKTLYALTRAIGATRACELGTHYGASANHLAAALAANGGGLLTCIDIWGGAGSMIHDDLRPQIGQVFMPGQDWLRQQPERSLDLIFEDADHDEGMIAIVGELARTRLRPGGLLISHDAAHATAGEHVRAGLQRAGLDYFVVLTHPSDCGLAVWRRPPMHGEMPLLKNELSGVIAGHSLEVKPNGEAKLNRKRAPDKQTRKAKVATP